MLSKKICYKLFVKLRFANWNDFSSSQHPCCNFVLPTINQFRQEAVVAQDCLSLPKLCCPLCLKAPGKNQNTALNNNNKKKNRWRFFLTQEEIIVLTFYLMGATKILSLSNEKSSWFSGAVIIISTLQMLKAGTGFQEAKVSVTCTCRDYMRLT